VPSHFGAVERQGQAAVPVTQVLGEHVPAVQLKPASTSHASPVPHAHPLLPSGHAPQSPPGSHFSPALQVLFDRQMQAASPRLQLVQVLATHSPAEQALFEQSQPSWPPQPASLELPPSITADVPGHAVKPSAVSAHNNRSFWNMGWGFPRV
jgi:hypothetical protein